MCEVYEPNTATGKYATNGSGNNAAEEDEGNEGAISHQLVSEEVPEESDLHDDSPTAIGANRHMESPAPLPATGKRKRQNGGDKVAEALNRLSQQAEVANRHKARAPSAIREAIEIVKTAGWLDPMGMLDLGDIFTDDENKAHAFCAYDEETQIAWIKRYLPNAEIKNT